MKIALCHLELSCGPQERNLQLLEQACVWLLSRALTGY